MKVQELNRLRLRVKLTREEEQRARLAHLMVASDPHGDASLSSLFYDFYVTLTPHATEKSFNAKTRKYHPEVVMDCWWARNSIRPKLGKRQRTSLLAYLKFLVPDIPAWYTASLGLHNPADGWVRLPSRQDGSRQSKWSVSVHDKAITPEEVTHALLVFEFLSVCTLDALKQPPSEIRELMAALEFKSGV